MIELRCEYLSVRCIWLYVLIMSRTRLRVKPHSIVCCGFESSCGHLNFRFRVCFEQGVRWHSGSYRMWIHHETRTWHKNNIQSNAPYRWVFITQLNQFASLAKWLSVRLWIEWLWLRVPLQSLKLQISRLLPAESSLTFRQL